jgi:L-amino acid N-acyltransferase YncA
MSRRIYARIELSPMKASDWPAVREVYLAGIASGNATFETTTPSWDQWDAAHLTFGRLVASGDGKMKGWAALSRVSPREAYAGVVDVSIYVAADARGQGYGHALLEALIVEAESNGIWMLQAGIFPENLASIKLHQRCGFRQVGSRERIAKLNGIWRNTVLMERRSTLVGTDAGRGNELDLEKEPQPTGRRT